MDSWKDLTLGDISKALARYRPFIAAVVAVVVVAVLLPGHGDRKSDVAASAGAQSETTVAEGEVTGPATATDVTADTSVSGPSAAGGGSRVTTPAGGVLKLPSGAKVGPDCDAATGRIKVPSLVAPPCMPPFSGSNGGSTASGVNAKEIKVVFYQPQDDPLTTAALTAAGANNAPDDVWKTYQDYTDYFNKFYEAYGRKVVLTRVQGSGSPSDPAAANADGQTIVGMKPFAVWGGNLPSFYEVLARNRILCICTTSQPQETYEKSAPYVGYTPLMASTQAYIHRAEYIGKRLAGRKAVHAGSPVFQQQQRVFGLLYYETADQAYRAGAEFFKKEITKYGTSFKVVLPYRGPPDYAGLQEDVQPLIQRLKDAGVTSVAMAADPISPAQFTLEATRQQYNPEWIITGSALTDTDLFARTYDRTQWSHAFGISLLTARLQEDRRRGVEGVPVPLEPDTGGRQPVRRDLSGPARLLHRRAPGRPEPLGGQLAEGLVQLPGYEQGSQDRAHDVVRATRRCGRSWITPAPMTSPRSGGIRRRLGPTNSTIRAPACTATSTVASATSPANIRAPIPKRSCKRAR